MTLALKLTSDIPEVGIIAESAENWRTVCSNFLLMEAVDSNTLVCGIVHLLARAYLFILCY